MITSTERMILRHSSDSGQWGKSNERGEEKTAPHHETER
jgi:hypothetical protein